MALVVALIWGALMLPLVVSIARDVRNIRRYKQERAEADALANRAVDCLILGDVDEATRLARLSRGRASKALDIMETW